MVVEPDAPPLSPLLESVRAPIAGADPAGRDVTYDDTFLQLKEEMDKAGSATAEVDYGRVVDLGSQILTAESKDLTAASYLAIGLLRTRGLEGLAEGVAATRLIVEEFWEGAFPPLRRMRARRNALQFLADNGATWIEENKPGPADREALERLKADVEALQAFVAEAMADEAPAFSRLAREVRENLQRLPAPAAPEPAPAEPAPSEAPAGSTAPAATPSAAPATPAAVAAPAVESASDVPEAVIRAAGVLGDADPLDPVAMRLRRVVRWGVLAQPPPAEGGRTMVPAPPEHRRAAVPLMLQNGGPDLVVREAEAMFQEPPFHFWLDLQRHLVEALDALGEPAAAAREAVAAEAGALVRRLPDLPALAFDDGTPFADAATQEWLAGLAAGGGGGGPAPRSGADGVARDARAKAAGGDLAGALAALATPGGLPRERFTRRLVAAELCLGAERPDVARPILEALDEEARERGLDAWEPDLVLEALRLARRCYRALADLSPDDPEAQQALRKREAEAFARLCRLDPAGALAPAP